jgi:ribosomal protein S6--L-glutamate ligase
LDIAGVDILRSERGPLIMEVNASPGLEGIETYTQVDVAGKIFDFVEKKVLALRNGKVRKKVAV